VFRQSDCGLFGTKMKEKERGDQIILPTTTSQVLF
jgi:hypothetical protein